MQRQMPKQFSKDLIWASKPFKVLSEMNFKVHKVFIVFLTATYA